MQKSIITNVPERMRERERKGERKVFASVPMSVRVCKRGCVRRRVRVRESEKVRMIERKRESPTDFAESFKGRKSDIR